MPTIQHWKSLFLDHALLARFLSPKLHTGLHSAILSTFVILTTLSVNKYYVDRDARAMPTKLQKN